MGASDGRRRGDRAVRVVYLDLYLILNITVNYLLLACAARLDAALSAAGGLLWRRQLARPTVRWHFSPAWRCWNIRCARAGRRRG